MTLARTLRTVAAVMLAAAALPLSASDGLPALPDTPVAPIALVAARPFVVAAPFVLRGSADRPRVERGWILVLDVDPAIGMARQLASPVLYVGDRAAVYGARPESPSRVVALVPGDVDLASAPIWFGTPELPERVDPSTAPTERARAEAAGIGPIPDAALRRAIATGGARLDASDEAALERAASALLDRLDGSR